MISYSFVIAVDRLENIRDETQTIEREESGTEMMKEAEGGSERIYIRVCGIVFS
jgi:hypothetical protein